MADTAKVDWLERGLKLKCFSNNTNQIAYYNAYARGRSLTLVKRELERIFTIRYNLQVINYADYPELYAKIEGLRDGPKGIPSEELRKEHFNIDAFDLVLPFNFFVLNGEMDQQSLNILLTKITKEILFKTTSNKKQLISSMENYITERHKDFSLTVSELAKVIVYLSFFRNCSSITISNAHSLEADCLMFVRRFLDLSDVYNGLFINQNKPMTLSTVRQSSSIGQLDLLLEAYTKTSNQNLINYLRCRTFEGIKL